MSGVFQAHRTKTDSVRLMSVPRGRQLIVAAVGILLMAPLALVATSSDAAPERTSGPAQSAVRDQAAGLGARPQLPLGGRTLFPRYRLVAYYGTAGTGSLGVLGEAPPGPTTKRLRAVAKRYRDGRRQVQITYELISTVADASPGSDGDYSHSIAKSSVRQYVRAARRHRAYLVLDLQPGRSTFLSQARHFRWALAKPWVGLALDPEWRMGPGEVPGRQIGSVRAQEVNRVSGWLAKLTRRHALPQKLLILHQFRTDMVQNPQRIADRPGLALVQHVDGFGSRSQKLATYHTVERAEQFTMGFKLFYDEDSDLFEPRRVLEIRPRISYVSYQ
jgi:hypothetical protein